MRNVKKPCLAGTFRSISKHFFRTKIYYSAKLMGLRKLQRATDTYPLLIYTRRNIINRIQKNTFMFFFGEVIRVVTS